MSSFGPDCKTKCYRVFGQTSKTRKPADQFHRGPMTRKVEKFICQYYLTVGRRRKAVNTCTTRRVQFHYSQWSLILISSNGGTNFNVLRTCSSRFAHFFTPMYSVWDEGSRLRLIGLQLGYQSIEAFRDRAPPKGSTRANLSYSSPSVRASRCGRVHKTAHTSSS